MIFPDKYSNADFVIQFKLNKDLGSFDVVINPVVLNNPKAISVLSDLKLFFEKERKLEEIDNIIKYMSTHHSSFIKCFAKILQQSIDAVWIDHIIQEVD